LAGFVGEDVKRDEMIGGIVLFLFGVVTTFLSLRMEIGTFRAAGTGLFPLALGILLMLLSGAFLLEQFSEKPKTAKIERGSGFSQSTLQLILFFGTMALATLFLGKLGYPVVAFLLLMVLFRILGMKHWSSNLLLSFATAAFSYILFARWLKIPLPKGWIGI
jgi:hypothetical protein